MTSKKNSDLERAEELGKEILRVALEQKKDILKRVDEDVQIELGKFKESLPKDNIDNSQMISELEKKITISKENEMELIKE